MNNALEATMQELAKSMTIMNYDYIDFKKDTLKKLNEHDEMIKKKIQLTPSECKNLRIKVKERIKEICKENNLQYHKVKSKLFSRMYSKINDKNQVASYRELPSFYYKEIMKDIDYITVYIEDIKMENILINKEEKCLNY